MRRFVAVKSAVKHSILMLHRACGNAHGPSRDALIRYVRNRPEIATLINGLLALRPPRVVIVAVANKLARIACAVMVGSKEYRGGVVSVS